MKSAYVLCALLCVAIDTLVLASDGAAVKATSTPVAPTEVNTKEISTTAIPTTTKVTSEPNVTTNFSVSTTISTNPTISTTTLPTTIIPPVTTTNSSTIKTVTTAAPPTTTTVKPSTSSSVTPPSSSTATPNSTAAPQTTPVPPASKNRHFDGLSFFGTWYYSCYMSDGNFRVCMEVLQTMQRGELSYTVITCETVTIIFQ
ncbi:hypothetical protein EAI_12033 [Harpegnathos saltator]|uniref:Uncharacterized protein n=1 Tax=Harpegnathos saltator TaxID=610380 RepID=E2B6V1_HARSA|nr:hypothetical protein EAI_12033 [Harpegnathos saltator]